MLRVISSLYHNVQYKVKTPQGHSLPFSSNVGVKQGCILSPTLFNLFINDLSSYLDHENSGVCIDGFNICHLLFADDLVLLSQSPSHLQKLLNKVSKYCSINWLTINIEKTKVVIFGSKHKNSNFKWFLNGQDVTISDHYNYLGIVIHQNSKFKECIDSLVKKGQRAYHVLASTLFGDELNPKISCNIFKTIVEPIFMYKCEA